MISGARLTRKSLKLSPDRLAMMMLGGSPISVAVPPMLEAIASAIRNGIGGTPSRSHTSSVTGATSSTVVTLSSSAEAAAVIRISITITANGRPRARLADQIARYSNTPVCLTTLTMIIIPSSRKMTFQSTPVSSLKNAVFASTTPSSTMAAAPPSAAATRWMRSVAISTYAATNVASTSQVVNAWARPRAGAPAAPETTTAPTNRDPSMTATIGLRCPAITAAISMDVASEATTGRSNRSTRLGRTSRTVRAASSSHIESASASSYARANAGSSWT